MRLNNIGALVGAGLIAASQALAKPLVFGYLQYSDNVNMDIDFSKYTHINMAFAIPAEDGSFSMQGDASFRQAVDKVHETGAKVQISMGGWGGSAKFSSIMKDEATRSKFIDNIVDFIRTNDLDGVDLDWEYPGREGNACNVVDKQNDTANYQKFLESLRQKLDSEFGKGNKIISMAVRVQPFDGPDGPMKNVSAIADLVDYAFLMQYDFTGAWAKTTGANAPLNFEPDKSAPISFSTAIREWTAAGWPCEKLVAGLAFYGRSTQALEDMTNTDMYRPQSSVVPMGDQEDKVEFDACAGTNGSSGIWRWKNLRGQNVLETPTSASEPWVRKFDERAKTPWLFNKETKIFISYDDPESIKAKVNHAKEKGLAGAMIWSIEMDTDKYELTNAILDNWK
uniref:chitinase n=1 Tax=Hirsutella thompsonii TaxID=42368 RepID=A0A097F8M7_HIRTH|nr:chitinase [Hirsutella thompsonii]